MGLHYTVNNSTSKKCLALGSSFWHGLRNFGYVFAIFCTHQLVSKKSYIMGRRNTYSYCSSTSTTFSTSSAMYCTSSIVHQF